jgi:hypothetical protein
MRTFSNSTREGDWAVLSWDERAIAAVTVSASRPRSSQGLRLINLVPFSARGVRAAEATLRGIMKLDFSGLKLRNVQDNINFNFGNHLTMGVAIAAIGLQDAPDKPMTAFSQHSLSKPVFMMHGANDVDEFAAMMNGTGREAHIEPLSLNPFLHRCLAG